MDTLIFLVSAAVLVTLGYGVFWTVRAVRRVGLRRFAGALGVLCWDSLKAILRLFKPDKERPVTNGENPSDDFVDIMEDLRMAREARKWSEERGRWGAPTDSIWDDSDGTWKGS
ncbi:MAG: hypothetical protein ACREX4_16465 [Gammaproteobacteria bacterium]